MKNSIEREVFLNKAFSKEDLIKNGLVTVDLKNNPFQSPKIQVDLTTPSKSNIKVEKEIAKEADVKAKLSEEDKAEATKEINKKC